MATEPKLCPVCGYSYGWQYGLVRHEHEGESISHVKVRSRRRSRGQCDDLVWIGSVPIPKSYQSRGNKMAEVVV